jgi:hypothetical protein
MQLINSPFLWQVGVELHNINTPSLSHLPNGNSRKTLLYSPGLCVNGNPFQNRNERLLCVYTRVFGESLWGWNPTRCVFLFPTAVQAKPRSFWVLYSSRWSVHGDAEVCVELAKFVSFLVLYLVASFSWCIVLPITWKEACEESFKSS